MGSFFSRATLIAQAVPATHWKTLSLIVSGLVAFLIISITRRNWAGLKNALRENVKTRLLFFVIDPFFALVLSAVASYYDIFKPATYSSASATPPDWHTVFWAGGWTAIATTYVIVKFAAVAHKEDEQSRSKALEADLTKERAAIGVLQRQRDLLLKIMNFTRRTVGLKKKRLLDLNNTKQADCVQLIETLAPKVQLHILRDLIFEFFQKQHTSGDEHVLRLALYMLDDEVGGQFDIVMSWDGATENCFSRRAEHKKYLNVLDPDGAQSAIIQAYQATDQKVLVISNCEQAEKEGTFRYWYPEQRRHLKSMIAYKHVFHDRQDAIVLMMTSSIGEFFKLETAEEYRVFLEEILTRIEMEWILLEVANRILPGKAA